MSDHADDIPELTPRHRWRSASVLLGCWVVFALLETAIVSAAGRDAGEDWGDALRVNLAVALYWAAISVPVARYHSWLRVTLRAPAAIVTAHAPVVAIVVLGATAATRYAWRWLTGDTSLVPFSSTLTYYADLEVASYVAIVAVTELLRTRRALVERQQIAARLETLLARARLDFLEAQLHPHFLFNALGAVSELAYEAPAAAGRVLRALIAIIRGALSTKSGEVTLGEELIAIEPYLEIQRIRFADWLCIDYEVDAAALECLVPRFVLQPLLENAIRHGLTGRTAPGSITISARVQGDALTLRVADNGVGLRPSRGTAGYGIGLANLRQRLSVLYGHGERLRLLSDPASGTVAELRLDRRTREHALAPERERAGVGAPRDDHELVERTVAPPSPSRERAVLTMIGVWVGCGLLWTQQSFAYLAVRNRLGESSWLSVARNDMASALVWMALTPLVFLVTRRFPIRRPWLPARVIGYLCLAAVLARMHALVLQRVTNPDSPFWTPLYQGTVIVDLAIVGVLVAIGHRRQLSEWLRDRELAAAALSAEVRTARARAEQLQAVSPLLVQALESIAEVAPFEPQRTEELLTRLADYLRVAIECSDDHGVTAEREAALNYCLARFEERGGFVLQPNPGA